MKFTSQICTTKEQSERLMSLGLKKETADCILVQNPFYADEYVMFPIVDIDETLENEMSDEPIPTWSLDRLISMISDSNTSENYKVEFYTKLNRYDEAIALIQSMIHIGQFNKEYLTE
jgi:hypothetical protein